MDAPSLAGHGKPFLNLAVSIPLDKDVGWFDSLLIKSNNIFLFFLQKFSFFSLHGGVLGTSGGTILVRKVAGKSRYKGSYANGVHSLSLP